MRKINKAGKTNPLMTAFVIVGVIALLVFVASETGLMNFSADSNADSPEDCASATATLTYPVKNAYVLSSSITGVTPYGRIGGGDIVNLSSAGAIGVGKTVTDVFYSASNYIDVQADDFTVGCGDTQAPSVRMKPTDNPTTFLLKDDSGTTLSDGATGGSANLSQTAGTLEIELRVGASTDSTTGNLVIVVEYDNDTQADTISMTDATEVSIPEVYTEEASGSLVKAFRITEVEDGATRSHTVKIEPESSQTLGIITSAIRFTRYSEQSFEDVNGEVVVGIENSDGTLKYEDTGDYDTKVT